MKPRFLNVDLEIVSSAKLDALAEELVDRVVVLYLGPAAKPRHCLLSIEIAERVPHNPDAVIHALCEVVESLSPPCRRVWERARKEFDVGYELRPSERFSRFSLRPDTLSRIAALGANLTVTYYPAETSRA